MFPCSISIVMMSLIENHSWVKCCHSGSWVSYFVPLASQYHHSYLGFYCSHPNQISSFLLAIILNLKTFLQRSSTALLTYTSPPSLSHFLRFANFPSSETSQWCLVPKSNWSSHSYTTPANNSFGIGSVFVFKGSYCLTGVFTLIVGKILG